MNQAPEWTQSDVDTSRVSISRMYDYFLGGQHHFEVDREFAEQVVANVPEAPEVARLNRAFLRRAVRLCLANGVRQFLDIGSGIPTVGSVGNVHDIAQTIAPDSVVVYADIDPIAVDFGRTILADNPRAAMVGGDLRNPEHLLATPEITGLLDFGRPIALLLLGVLHYVSDEEDPYALVRNYRGLLVPGSHLVVSHGTEGDKPMSVRSMIGLTKSTKTPGYMRTPDEVRRFFTGFDLFEPGVVQTPDWRPDQDSDPGSPAARALAVAGVGRRTAD